MSEYQHREGSGSLFRNGYKEKDSQPDFRGDFMLNGEMFEIAAWQKKTGQGKSYLSLSVKPKQERERPQRDTGAAYRAAKGGDRKPADDFEDSDLPF